MGRHRFVIAALWGVVGAVAVVITLLYYAYVAQISAPVDWPKTWTIALYFAPLGAFGAAAFYLIGTSRPDA